MSNYKRTLGHRKVDRETFDIEIERLIGLGLGVKDISFRLKVSRWTVKRAVDRLKRDKPKALEEAKTAGAYVKLSGDSFRGLPEVMSLIENMRARGIGYAPVVRPLKQICDALQIYPSMLDGAWAQKWLAMQDKTKAQLRSHKIALRTWLKFAFKVDDNQLQVLGLDAKHYEVGKWATVNLLEDQIQEGYEILQKGYDTKELLVFRLGTECCTPLQELERMKRSDYLVEEGILRTFRPKTGSYWSKYPAPYTAKLIMESPTEQIFRNGDFRTISDELKDLYRQLQATSDYFKMRPIHALRHVGAQRLLRKTNWNRAVVAVLGGWEAEKTLEDHYGAVPNEIIHKVGRALWG